MKEEAPLGTPFIGEVRCGQPTKVGGQAANPCGQKHSNLSQYAVVEIKRKIVEGKEGKRGGRWPANHKSLAERQHLASTQLLLSFFTTTCSSHAHSIDPKASKVKQIPFIFF
jgi:hypothetical protein